MFDYILSAAASGWDNVRETVTHLKKALSLITRNLKLLSCVYLARFIVWRELRRVRRQQERASASLR